MKTQTETQVERPKPTPTVATATQPRRTPEIWIENDSPKGKVIAGQYTKVFAVVRDDRGVEIERVDISNVVRAADVRMHVGEVITAKLEVFVTNVKTRAVIDGLTVKDLCPSWRWRLRRWWTLRGREVTTFASKGVREYVR